MSVTTCQVIAQETRPMASWRDEQGRAVEATVLITSDGRAYVPFTFLCRAIGLSDVQRARTRATEHAVLGRMLAQFPVETAGGRQLAWCVERRALGFWLGTINVQRLRPEVRPRLIEFQEQLVDLADRLLHGEVEVTPTQALTELNRLKSAQADALSFVLSLERRIGALEQVTFAPAVGDDDDEAD